MSTESHRRKIILVDQTNVSRVSTIRIQLINNTASKCFVDVSRLKEQIIIRDVLPESRTAISCRLPIGAVWISLAIAGKATVFQTLGNKISTIIPFKKFIFVIVTRGMVSANSFITGKQPCVISGSNPVVI